MRILEKMRQFVGFLGLALAACGGDDFSSRQGAGGADPGAGGAASAAAVVAAGGMPSTGGTGAAPPDATGGAPSLACSKDGDCAAGWLCADALCRKPCTVGRTQNRSADCQNESEDYCTAIVGARFVNNCDGKDAPRACTKTQVVAGGCPL